MAKPRAKSGMKRAPAKRRPRKAKAGTRGLLPAESRLDSLPEDAQEAHDRIEREGGFVVGAYNDPLGKNALLLAVLPIARIEPTPFQRDLSQAHHRKLADVLDRTGMFLDPVIAVTAPKEGFWTPNGPSPAGMRRLRAKSITTGRAQARDRLADPRAQHRKNAQPARALARGDPYLPRPHGRGREALRSGLLLPQEAAFVTLGVCYEEQQVRRRRVRLHSEAPQVPTTAVEAIRAQRRNADGTDGRVAE
jgi:ParB family chromosome partitioning protein